MKSDNWAYRRAGMNCERCIFFVQKLIGNPNEPMKAMEEKPRDFLGRCRRHAPCQVVLGWPSVFSSDWCGDFKLDENKL